MQIYINSKPYRIEIQSYRAQDVTNFAPRAATPGGGIVYSELGLYQPLHQGSWHHGFGFPWHEDEAGYLVTQGSVDTRHKGIAMLMTKTVVHEAGFTGASTNAYINGFVAYQGDWYYFGRSGSSDYAPYRKHTSTGTALNVWPNSTDIVVAAWQNGKYLFAALDKDTGGGLYYTSNPSTQPFSTDASVGWSQTGLSTNTSVDYKWITHHDGFVYAGKQRDTNYDAGNEVYYDDNVDLSQLAGTSSDDPNMIPVGLKGGAVLGAQSYLGDLLLLRTDGVYKMDASRESASLVLDFKGEDSLLNFRGWTIHNGYFIFSIRDVVYQWNGLRLTDITPMPIEDVFPFDSFGSFSGFVTIGKYLYCSADNSDNSYSTDSSLLCYDGVSWHQLSYIPPDPPKAFEYDPINNRLWMSFRDSSQVSSLKYLQFKEQSFLPYPNFPLSTEAGGPHEIISSRYDAGYRRVDKSSPELAVEANNCTALRGLLIYYSLDGAAWKPWGGTDLTTNTVTTNGTTVLRDPLGTGATTLEYEYIQIKVKFFTLDATQSPILEGLILKLIMRPDEGYGERFIVIAGDQLDHGGQVDDRRPDQIWDDLKTARASKSPVTYIDMWGDTHQVYLTAINKQAVEVYPEKPGAKPIIEMRVAVNIVEVST